MPLSGTAIYVQTIFGCGGFEKSELPLFLAKRYIEGTPGVAEI